MSELKQYHNAAYDPLVDEAVRFSGKILGLQVVGPEKITVLSRENVLSLPAEVRKHYNFPAASGGYDPITRDVLVLQDTHPGMPRTTRVSQGSLLVHEITHSGTADPLEHPFYTEALAGMGEAKYLEWLVKYGVYRHIGPGIVWYAGIKLWFPGELRMTHVDEVGNAGKKNYTSRGLIAALGVGYGLQASGETSANVLRSSRRSLTEPYALMRQSLNALRPGLSRRIERGDGSIEGILEATAQVERAARRAGILPADS